MAEIKIALLIILFSKAYFNCIGQNIIEERIDSIILNYIHTNEPGIAIGIYKAGEIIFSKGYGQANLEHNVPFTPQTIFDIASNSKQFTAFAILLLEQRKKLSLSDPIHKYIKGLPEFTSTITIYNLIHNTSGLRDFGDLLELSNKGIDYRTSRNEFMQIIKSQKSLNFLPGEEYSYSNTNWILLAMIIEKIEGLTFKEFMQKEIFDPLGMKNTIVRDNPNLVIPNCASYYKLNQDGNFGFNFSWGRAYNLGGMAFINTTIDDLAKWDSNFYSGKIGGRKLIDRMYQKGVLNSGDSIHYAYGLNIGKYKGHKIVLHGGLGGGSSQITRFPDEELTLVIFSNRKHSDLDTYDLIFELADHFIENKNPNNQFVSKPAYIDKNVGLETFANRYWNDKNLTFSTFVIDNNQLSEVWGEERYPLKRTGTTLFQDDIESFQFSLDGLSAKGKHKPSGEIYTLTIKPVWNPLEENLERYTGVFECTELGVRWNILLKDHGLIVKRLGKSDFDLEPVFKNSFKHGNWLISFDMDKDNSITLKVSTDRCKNIIFNKL